jgi:gluconate 2-dehydrogenase gamma chain
MDRRKSIKALVVGTLATGVLVEACQPGEKKLPDQTKPTATGDAAIRMPEEMIVDSKLREEKFFEEGELATITVLADIIIPRDDVSGSASDAKVTEFIEFMVNDKPEFRTPLRGGLRWLDMYCLNQFGKQFRDLGEKEQLSVVDEIAYPEKARPEFRQGVAFFTLMRNLTMSGFYTTEIGVKDIGFMGNRPNQWNGVPDDVLKQHQLAYSEKELKECISFEKTT